MFKIAAAAVISTMLIPTHLGPMGQEFTSEQIEWMERQYSISGEKCCNEHDAYVGEYVQWRMQGQRYQVLINNRWYDIEPGTIMKPNTEDPSPFGYQALVFYSFYPTGVRIWCFSPEPMM